MRYGNKRIILDSTSKMGKGINIQDRLIARNCEDIDKTVLSFVKIKSLST
jgi:hypothetical protein